MRILVVDDHDVVRRGLRSVLEAHQGWQVCAEAANGRNAVTQAEQLKPDVVVMDISMPDMNGLEAARQIKKILPKAEIVILSVHFSDQLVRDIVDAGAKSYILKSDAERDLVIAVEAVANHRSYFTTQVSEMVMDGFRRRDTAPSPQALKRSAASRRPQQQTGGNHTGNQHQDRRNASRQHNAQTGNPFSKRSSALRSKKLNHRSISTAGVPVYPE